MYNSSAPSAPSPPVEERTGGDSGLQKRPHWTSATPSKRATSMLSAGRSAAAPLGLKPRFHPAGRNQDGVRNQGPCLRLWRKVQLRRGGVEAVTSRLTTDEYQTPPASNGLLEAILEELTTRGRRHHYRIQSKWSSLVSGLRTEGKKEKRRRREMNYSFEVSA